MNQDKRPIGKSLRVIPIELESRFVYCTGTMPDSLDQAIPYETGMFEAYGAEKGSGPNALKSRRNLFFEPALRFESRH